MFALNDGCSVKRKVLMNSVEIYMGLNKKKNDIMNDFRDGKIDVLANNCH